MNTARRKAGVLPSLTVQVVIGVALGIALGVAAPAWGAACKPISDIFVRLIKALVPLIAFLVVVLGVAGAADVKRVAKVGGLALLYFEIVTTLALGIGLVVVNALKPGTGFHVALPASASLPSSPQGAGSAPDFWLNLVPDNVAGAFAKGDLMQIVLFGIAFGCAAVLVGTRAKPILDVLQSASDVIFKLVSLVMRLAPIAAFAAIAYSVGKFGAPSLLNLIGLLGCVYLTCAFFVLGVLGGIARLGGFSVIRLIRYLSEEVLIVFGTTSSESVLPRLMEKLERLGCDRAVIGIVLPTGYSFNMDGTTIYLVMATIFIAQAFGIALSSTRQIEILLLLMVTSKGAGSVAGSGFVTLAATLSATRILPVEGLALLIGVDRFMSEARSVTNVIGNAVATVVVAKACRAFDPAKADAAYGASFEGARFHLGRAVQPSVRLADVGPVA